MSADTYLREMVARHLSKILDGNEVNLIVEEADDRFLENLASILRRRYGRGSEKILRRLEASLLAEDPSAARRLRRAWGRRTNSA